MMRFFWASVWTGLYVAVSVAAQDKEKRHPLEGTWRLVSFKLGDAKDVLPAPADETEMKIITTSQAVSFRYDNKTKEIIRGAGGSCSWKGESYEETIRYVIGSPAAAGPRGLLDKTYKSAWKIQDGKLHMVGEYDGQKVERIWERVK